MVTVGASNTRKADIRNRYFCGFFMLSSYGWVWANTRPAREIRPPSLRGLKHLAAYFLLGVFNSKTQRILYEY